MKCYQSFVVWNGAIFMTIASNANEKKMRTLFFNCDRKDWDMIPRHTQRLFEIKKKKFIIAVCVTPNLIADKILEYFSKYYIQL